MQITDLAAYKRLREWFDAKGFIEGEKDETPIYVWEDVCKKHNNIELGHYVYAVKHSYIDFYDVPRKYLTKEFFLHTLSGVYEDVVSYVREHKEFFDKQFFKDHIATNYYSLEFALNDFEYMPLEYIDEEMVACAMFRAINMRYVERRGDCDDWFYSVYKRKPEVLTQDMYILGARCFAERRNGVNKFLAITPEEYRTTEYYFALCLSNRTHVMEDIPDDILTNNFLVSLINESTENIRCFNEKALEMETEMQARGRVKFWQAAVINNGYCIRDIELNEERINFFLERYPKGTLEYEYGFKRHYNNYLRDQYETSSINKPKIMLPIDYEGVVPKKYYNMLNKAEYLLAAYKKLGIQIIKEHDLYYYEVVLPDKFSVSKVDDVFYVKDALGNVVIVYYDIGPFYDKAVKVREINVLL